MNNINATVYVSAAFGGLNKAIETLCDVRGVRYVSVVTPLPEDVVRPLVDESIEIFSDKAFATGWPWALASTFPKFDIHLVMWAVTPMLTASSIERCLQRVKKGKALAACTVREGCVAYQDNGQVRYKNGYVEVYGACAFRPEALVPIKKHEPGTGWFEKCAPVGVTAVEAMSNAVPEEANLLGLLDPSNPF